MEQNPNEHLPRVDVPRPQPMDPTTVQRSDFLDLLFANRNKAYGAYDLRRTYNKRMGTAMLITGAVGLLIFLSSFLSKQFADTAEDIKVDDVELAQVKEEEPPPPEPPPPPPPETEPPPKVEMTKFTPPEIVPDEQVKEEEKPPKDEDLQDTKIDVVSQEGIKDEGIAAPVVDEGKAVVEAPKDETNYDQTFTKVEIEAEFPGGQAAWRRFLTNNLNSQAPVDNGAPSGVYTVKVQFIVDKDGNVSDVKALTNHGHGMEEEAVRAIRKGPKWTPAVQNGRQVKAYRTQPVTFQVSEGE